MKNKTDEFEILCIHRIWSVFCFFKLPGFMSKCRLRNTFSLLEIAKYFTCTVHHLLSKENIICTIDVCINF